MTRRANTDLPNATALQSGLSQIHPPLPSSLDTPLNEPRVIHKSCQPFQKAAATGRNSDALSLNAQPPGKSRTSILSQIYRAIASKQRLWSSHKRTTTQTGFATAGGFGGRHAKVLI
jgi:hypothetical protein